MTDELDYLRDYIMSAIPGESCVNEGAGRTAVRLLRLYRKAFRDIIQELGIPGPGDATYIACHALGEGWRMQVDDTP
jgi:hypothetical protein